MGKYKKYFKGIMVSTILAPILMIIDTIGALVQPYYMGKIIDIGIATGDSSYILKTGLIMIVFAIISMIGGFGCMYFSSKSAYGFAANLRKDLIAKIQEFSFANINKFSTASLITRLTNDVEVLSQLIQMMLRMMVRAPFMFIGGFAMAIIINKKLSLIIVVLIPVIGAGIFFLIKKAFPYFNLMQTKIDKVNGVIRENLIGARVIKAFVREEQQIDRFGKANTDLKETAIKSFNVLIMMLPLVFIVMNSAIAGVLWFGSILAKNGEIEIGSLSSYITYITMTLSSLIMLSMVFMNASRAKVSSNRILEVLNTDADIRDNITNDENMNIEMKDRKVVSGDIEYNIKSFEFADSKGDEILKDVQFEIKQGQTIAIIGSTGCGKSTLVNLMPRFYDVTDGYVKIGGIDVRDYTLEHLRDGIGMVLQENRLFSGTIKENIKWGKKDATDDEIKHACKVAQIDEFIENLPDKYESKVEQRGSNFSGGQKQRLCIARALIKNPKILILDDSVSALDMTTEANLRQALDNEYSDTTIFIITQRINSCVSADKIIVLEKGTVSGIGTHDELMKNNEVYKEIYASQQEVVSHE